MPDISVCNEMVRQSLKIACFVVLSCSLACVSRERNPDKEQPAEKQENEQQTYTNPVFSPVLADPSIIKHEGYFYAYGTENNWGKEGGYHLVPVVRSRDLVNWTFVNDALTAKPDWKQEGNI